MDAKAIERIEQLVAAGNRLPTDTDVPAVILPDGAAVKSLEHLLAAPRQMQQTYRTERLEDFCRYAKAESESSDEDAAVFVLPDGSGAKAIMDYGCHTAPLWGKHSAVLEMRPTAEFASLRKASASPLGQRELIDWLEDWSHIVTPYRGDDTLSLTKALATIRRVDIKQSKSATHEQNDWSAARSSMEQIEARSGEESMPEGFRVRCQVYPHTQERDITVRLSLLTGDDKPRLRLRIVGLDALMKAIADEIELEIATRLLGVRVFVGSV
jgi:uncharacterized protein YfdQ (DUF2303 family)